MQRILKPFSVIFLLFLVLLNSFSGIKTAQAATLTINDPSVILKVGETKSLYMIGTSKTVSWSSGNSSVAAVSSSGKVMAKAPGTATIYASVAGKKFTSKITVLKISSTSAVLAAGAVKTLKIYGTSGKITWSSDNTAAASVSSGGTVTAKKAGTANISASVLGRRFTCKITVLKINSATAELAIGGLKTLKVSGASEKVTWSTSKSSVATVSQGGTVTAKSTGTATITAAVAGIKLYSKITVISTVIPAPSAAPVPTNTPSDTQGTASDSSEETTGISQQSAKIVGYYAAWSKYSGYTPDKIDATRLTHINYAFANIGSDLKITLGYPDIDEANFAKLNLLKKTNPNLKTLISVGGWTWSGRFSDAALTEEARLAFADSCVDFIAKYGFDGVDIDWEYPVSGGLSTNTKKPEDKYNFTLLLKTLREQLDARGRLDGRKYLLSFAGAAGKWYSDQTQLSEIYKYVDFGNIMTYDIHGTWELYTDFNAPLYGGSVPLQQSRTSVDLAVRTWLNAGFGKDKLVMGVPFYGHIYQAVTDNNHGLYQTYSGGASISYANIAANYLKAPGYQRFYDPDTLVPWLFNGSVFISYDDEQSLSAKAGYIREQGLSGAMIWELSQDPGKVLLNTLYQQLR